MAASYNGIPLPSSGSKITFENGKFVIPDNPIIPFIEGDGTGRDIWKASVRVFDAAVEIAYNGKRRVAWYEVFAGEKAMDRFKTWLPDDTVAAFRELRIGIKGPSDDSGRRRHPLTERRVAADPRSLCLCSAGEVLQGHSLAGEEPAAHEHRHLPREYGRRLCRHRMERGYARGERADRIHQQQDAGRAPTSGFAKIPA